MKGERRFGGERVAAPREPARIERRDVGPSVAMCRDQVRRWLRVPVDGVLVVSTVKVHQADALVGRLLAIERLFEGVPPLGSRLVFVQLAPTVGRAALERARDIVERINGKFGDGRHHPAVLLESEPEGEVSRRFERAADLRWPASPDALVPFTPDALLVERDDDAD